MRLTPSQNVLYFGIKCSKWRLFLGLCPRPRWGAYDAPSDPLVVRSFLPLAIAPSRLRHQQFSRLTCLYAKKLKKIPSPESNLSAPTAPRYFFTSNMSHYLKSLKICPVIANLFSFGTFGVLTSVAMSRR